MHTEHERSIKARALVRYPIFEVRQNVDNRILVYGAKLHPDTHALISVTMIIVDFDDNGNAYEYKPKDPEKIKNCVQTERIFRMIFSEEVSTKENWYNMCIRALPSKKLVLIVKPPPPGSTLPAEVQLKGHVGKVMCNLHSGFIGVDTGGFTGIPSITLVMIQGKVQGKSKEETLSGADIPSTLFLHNLSNQP